MPAFTFTADPATDQLHIVAHGLNTGDGPGATRNVGGALPTPLVWVTDYWIIRDDADHVRLADSSAHALAGVAINLTDGGGGTNTLELGIPFERATTYAVGVQVKSADLDSLQDSWKALHRLLTGQPQTLWSALRFAVPVAVNHANVVKPFAIDLGDLVKNTGGTGFVPTAGTPGGVLGAGGDAWFKLPALVTTDRLQTVTVWAHDANATSTMQVYVFDESGVAAVVASASVGMLAGGLAPVVLPITAPSVAAGRMYMLRVQAGTDVHMSKGEITVDAP